MPVVGVFIDDTIGLNGVPSYENKQMYVYSHIVGENVNIRYFMRFGYEI